jgi:PAS domain S-box-containing protein
MEQKKRTNEELVDEIKALQERLARSENELRESEKRMSDFLFSAVDWIWEVDASGVYTYSSHKSMDIFGRSPEEIVGKTPFDFMPPEEAKRIAAIFSEIMAKKAVIKDLENWNIRKDGGKICLLTNGVPILDVDGNFKGYRGVDKDITERKAMEEEKRKRLKEMEVFFTAATLREERILELKKEIEVLKKGISR